MRKVEWKPTRHISQGQNKKQRGSRYNLQWSSQLDKDRNQK